MRKNKQHRRAGGVAHRSRRGDGSLQSNSVGLESVNQKSRIGPQGLSLTSDALQFKEAAASVARDPIKPGTVKAISGSFMARTDKLASIWTDNASKGSKISHAKKRSTMVLTGSEKMGSTSDRLSQVSPKLEDPVTSGLEYTSEQIRQRIKGDHSLGMDCLYRVKLKHREQALRIVAPFVEFALNPPKKSPALVDREVTIKTSRNQTTREQASRFAGSQDLQAG